MMARNSGLTRLLSVELLLGTKTYGPAIDMWSVGCIFYELLTREPMLPGKTEIEQIDKVARFASASRLRHR